MPACNDRKNWRALSQPVGNKWCEEIQGERAPRGHVIMAFNWEARDNELGKKVASAELAGASKGSRG